MDTYETKIYTAVIIAAIILGIIIAIFFISLIRHQRRLLEFHRRNILTEITTLENERSRIAADLHDELAPLLYLVKYQVNSLDMPEKEDNEMKEKSIAVLNTITERVRGISRDLLPSALTRKGLITAFLEYISDLNEAGNLRISFRHNIQQPISPTLGVNVFRILQEIIQNTHKHSAATELLVLMEEQNSILSITCEDNGKGFNYNKMMEEGKGLGLINIKSRTEILKGDLSVTSKAGKGTQFLFKIPFTP